MTQLLFCFVFLAMLHVMHDFILVSGPGINPLPPAVEVQSLNQWTEREIPWLSIFDSVFPLIPMWMLMPLVVCVKKAKMLWSFLMYVFLKNLCQPWHIMSVLSQESLITVTNDNKTYIISQHFTSRDTWGWVGQKVTKYIEKQQYKTEFFKSGWQTEHMYLPSLLPQIPLKRQ